MTKQEPENSEITAEPKKSTKGRKRRLVSRLFRFFSGTVLLFMMTGGGFFIGGFLKFTDTVSSYDKNMETKKADAIVVFTGGSLRIEEAISLLEDGYGKRLLISGVNPTTSRETLLKRTGINHALFDCCVDIDIHAIDTMGNAVEADKWAKLHEFKSLLIVTSAYHMPRSLLEAQRKLVKIELVPYPVAQQGVDHIGWYRDPDNLRLLLSEYSKYLAAQARPFLDRKILASVRSSMLGN